uniref:Ig-like domain-containing protein n=1 Tax=Periophthalmus magnuspinnatus TaxID=409849 RepID=A0A3B4B0X9_9GOBI
MQDLTDLNLLPLQTSQAASSSVAKHSESSGRAVCSLVSSSTKAEKVALANSIGLVTLICKTYYDPEWCGQVHAVWFRHELPLTNPEKYLTIVNETITERHWRSRQILTEILNLSAKDEGDYQCRATAECPKPETVMGHIMTVSVAKVE